ncbi:MFS transporter [Brotaphodocola sp.]|uniref:MFS transporter n=1 Tax=Brotaphodocola sp. TaxID=3073577 RepID=UPI003D7EA586
MNSSASQKQLALSVFRRCCYGYFVSGMVILSFGAIMPSLIAESGMNFATAGGLLSFMAIGNFLASFVFPAMAARFGLRSSISFWSFTIPIVLFLFSLLPPLAVMYALIFCIGLSRGSITIINNQAVNQVMEDPARYLNFLHCCFAIGAFSSPFLTACLLGFGFGWRTILYLLILLSASAAVCYFSMDYSLISAEKKSNPNQASKAASTKTASGNASASKNSGNLDFLKNSDFLCIAFVLFFYLGIENSINGWFVTYLQNTGIMSATFATNMVSVTWLMIMAGRLVTAKISATLGRSRMIVIQTIGSTAFFFLLTHATTLPMVTIALVGLGFFLAGIYPTCIAEGGQYIVGSTLGMSILTAVSALGGILTPALIGWIADRSGMTAAIGTLSVNVLLMILLGLRNYFRATRK